MSCLARPSTPGSGCSSATSCFGCSEAALDLRNAGSLGGAAGTRKPAAWRGVLAWTVFSHDRNVSLSLWGRTVDRHF